MGEARLMFEMTVREAEDGLASMRTVVIPVGIVEQHGYHLPLSVDIHNAVEISHRASEATGCFVTPPVHNNFSGGTLPGTINITPQVFSLLLMDICRSLVMQGFKNLVILLGHGGTESCAAARDAAEQFHSVAYDTDFNHRMNEFTAAVALAQLEAMPAFIEKLRRTARHYDDAVEGCSWIHVQLGRRNSRVQFNLSRLHKRGSLSPSFDRRVARATARKTPGSGSITNSPSSSTVRKTI